MHLFNQWKIFIRREINADHFRYMYLALNYSLMQCSHLEFIDHLSPLIEFREQLSDVGLEVLLLLFLVLEVPLEVPGAKPCVTQVLNHSFQVVHLGMQSIHIVL